MTFEYDGELFQLGGDDLAHHGDNLLLDRSGLLLDIETEFERRVSNNRSLATFRRNPTTWELLLLLASVRDGFTDGLHEVPNAIRTRYLGPSALLKFIREQRDAGHITVLEHQKRSKRVLRIDPEIAQQLVSLLHWREEALRLRALTLPPGHAEPARPETGRTGNGRG